MGSISDDQRASTRDFDLYLTIQDDEPVFVHFFAPSSESKEAQVRKPAACQGNQALTSGAALRRGQEDIACETCVFDTLLKRKQRFSCFDTNWFGGEHAFPRASTKEIKSKSENSVPVWEIKPKSENPLPVKETKPKSENPLPVKEIKPKSENPLPVEEIKPKSETPLPVQEIKPKAEKTAACRGNQAQG